MARIRTIKPEFCTSEQVSMCSRDARLLFVTMWCFCDDAGRHKASPKRLKMECFPGDAIGDAEVTRWVDELVSANLLTYYEVEGEGYWQVSGWHHQKIDKKTIKYPDPCGEIRQPVRRLGGKQRQLAMKRIAARDGNACGECGATQNLTLDHVVPISKGGTNDDNNLQILCKPCNNEKFIGTRPVRGSDAPPEGSLPEGSLPESTGVEGSAENATPSHSPGDSVIVPERLRTDEFRSAWSLWKRHVQERTHTRLGGVAEEVQLKSLAERFDAEEAIQVIEFSISKRAKNLITVGDHRQQAAHAAAGDLDI